MEYLIVYSTTVWILIVMGLIFNTFIVIKNFIWWWKGKTQVVGMIMTSMALTRILFLIFCVPIFFISDIEFTVPVNNYYEYVITAIKFVELCSLWWGTILCVFYCVKITTYSNRLFMRLKMNISRWVPWLLLITMIVAFLSSLPCIWLMCSVHDINSTQVINGSNYGEKKLEINNINLLIIHFGGSFIPLVVFCVAISFLIVSLLKHTRNMNSKDSGFTKSQLVAHIRAVINMASFLFLYVLFFIGSCLIPLTFHLQQQLYSRLCGICCIFYPSLHSVMLIISNGNLKRSALAILCWARQKLP